MTGNNAYYAYGTSGTDTGRPVWIEDGSGRYECHYDALGNVTSEVRSVIIPDDNMAYSFSSTYDYDSWGRMVCMTYPDGEKVMYHYNTAGELYSMNWNKGSQSGSFIDEVRYNKYGSRTRLEYGNHTKTYYSYDRLQRLCHLQSNDYNDDKMQDISYVFDRVGNILYMDNQASSIGPLGGRHNNKYSYDNIYRLTDGCDGGECGSWSIRMEYTDGGRIGFKTGYYVSDLIHRLSSLNYGYCDTYQPHAPRRIKDVENQKLYDLQWDKAGNLGRCNTAKDDGFWQSSRHLFWTIDNRMHAVIDADNYSYFTYDYTGERTLKLTGRNSEMDVNADIHHTAAVLDNPTLYPSPYIVVGMHGYTKHYYAGTERICAKIGGGFGAYIHENRPDLQDRADKLFRESRENIQQCDLPQNDMDCVVSYGQVPDFELNVHLSGMPGRFRTDVEISLDWFHHVVERCEHEFEDEKMYFYHSDHLGSASWITDNGGYAVQHLQYLPFGEPFVDQRTTGYSERFRFTGKERDEETGYGYFGARYMDHELMTMWLSVDPMADKYPSISPYAYCAWNPVKLVDPDGRDIWKLDNIGNVVDHIECNDYDCFHIVNDKGEIISSSNYYEFGTISELCLDGQSNTSFSVCGFENAKEIFEFLAGQYTKENNMPIEWAHGTVAATDSYGLWMDNSTNILTSTHEKAGVDLGVWIDNGYVISRQAHNHPSGTKRPSDIIEPNGRRHGDVPTALTFEKIFPSIENHIYIPSWGYSRYDSNGSLDSRVLNPNLPEVNINGERIK